MPHLAVFKANAFRKVHEKYGTYYDENLRVCNDYDMDLKLAQFGIVWHIPECLSIVREGINNSCTPIQGKIREECYMRLRETNKGFYE